MKNFSTILSENKAWAEQLFERLEKKFELIAHRTKGIVPNIYQKNGRFRDAHETIINDWVNGFYPGLNMLLYNKTKKDIYLEVAKDIELQEDPVLADFDIIHHDVGFIWHLMSGAIYRLTGDEKSRIRNLFAASVLSCRYVTDGKFITAWNHPERQNWTIIDTMMNLPLLYWASEDKQDDRFKRIAMAHADTALATHVREDGSVNHIVVHDRETGETVETLGGQGYGVGSSWSRGQSWAVYGFTLSYIHTGEKRYLDGAKRVANYFISACAANEWLPLLDFRAPSEPKYYDSTAGACAACGLIELARLLPENEGGLYLQAAINILKAMAEKFGNFDTDKDYFLGFGSARYPHTEYSLENEVHIPIIYGDFFFVEALLKLLDSDFLIW